MPLRLLHHQRQQVSVYMQTAALPLALLWQSLAMNHYETLSINMCINLYRLLGISLVMTHTEHWHV